MIEYDSGKWHVAFVFRLRGSVFPKALCWAVPSMLMAIAVFYLKGRLGLPSDAKISTMWSSYMFVLGFLIVFRSQQAYARYWEGVTILNQVRGEWFNACSSLFAFCTDKQEKKAEVKNFQHLIVRLMSLLYCSALQQVACMEDEAFETLDFSGVDLEKLNFLIRHEDARCEIILQWIQKSICNNIKTGVVDVAPPILSRVFQELSRGIVGINNATKLTFILFPFPYAQMVTTMLLITTFFTPIVSGTMLQTPTWAALLTFFSIFAFWSINYIAAEIELPFGDDANDLPIAEYQKTMNRFLLVLMEDGTQQPPKFIPTGDMDQPCQTIRMTDDIMARMVKCGTTVRGIGVQGVPGEGRKLPTRSASPTPGLSPASPSLVLPAPPASAQPSPAVPIQTAANEALSRAKLDGTGITAPVPLAASSNAAAQLELLTAKVSDALRQPGLDGHGNCDGDAAPGPTTAISSTERPSIGFRDDSRRPSIASHSGDSGGAPTVNVFVRVDNISAVTGNGSHQNTPPTTSRGQNSGSMQIVHPTQPNASSEPEPRLELGFQANL